ncbi:CHAT domain-containing protein, partial [Aquipuribacter nitratireducens]|uniref:CHAT domain-containing protein n=1 Tax=Aquipuribacter nitratireducens TaxID=650104 RepID=UPI0030EB5FDB
SAFAGARDRVVALRAAAALRRSGALTEAAEAYLVAGRVAAADGDRDAAVHDLARAADTAPRGPVLARAPARAARALVASLGGDDAALVRACRAGLADLARHRDSLPSTELRALAAGHGAELAALGLGALVRTGTPTQVLRWMERTRANALAATARGDEAGEATEAGEVDLVALHEVQVAVAAARSRGRVVPPALLVRQRSLEERVRGRAWVAGNGARTRPGEPGVTRVREALAGRVLVEYDVLDGDLVAVVLEQRGSRLVRLGPLDEVEPVLDDLRVTLRALPTAVPAMGEVLGGLVHRSVGRLRDLVVAPLDLPVGTAAAGVVVVPVGALQRAPWSALVDGPVSVAPSAALWWRTAVPATGAPDVPGPTVLVAGPGLAAAPAEVAVLADVHPGATVLVPPDSTSSAVRRALDGAGLAHLACHGEVRADNPQFSSLRLSDGDLTVHELEGRSHVPRRIVLAACDVGAGVVHPGNELLGFVGTLLARGARGIVASTTLVADAHVLPFVRSLHAGLAAGLPVAEALHGARQVLDPDDPRTLGAWAAFTAYGAG